MNTTKFPVKIVKDGGSLKVTTSVDSLYENRRNIRHELDYIQNDYLSLTKVLRELHSRSRTIQKSDPRTFWLIGDYVISFLQRLDSLGFYLVKQNETIARDISISESSIKKILSFRKRFPFISLVDPAIPWSQYRGNKISPNKVQNKQQGQE